MRRRLAVIGAVLAALAFVAVPLALALAAPGGLGGLAPPDQHSDGGQAISELYWFVFGICAIVFVLVETTLVLFVLRFRRRSANPEDLEGPQIHGNTRLEIIWTIIPAVILAAVAIVVVVRAPAVEARGGDRSNELVVRVEAHQFYWQYVYPDGQISLDTLVLPVGRPVTLEIVSYDVEHSWWVPALTGKKDAVPDRTNELSFRPSEEGTYEGHCGELCGILHAYMPTTVEVVSEPEFDDHLALLGGQSEQGTAAQLALGRETWDRVCADCHGRAGEGDVGPPIAQSGTLTNLEALTRIVQQGQNQPGIPSYMPPVGRGWPAFQREALVAYIRSNETLAPPGAQQQGQEQGAGG